MKSSLHSAVNFILSFVPLVLFCKLLGKETLMENIENNHAMYIDGVFPR